MKIVETHYYENVLDEQTIDNDLKLFTIASTKKIQPLGLFRDKHFEEHNFSMLSFGHPRPSFECSCIKKNTSWINKFQSKICILCNWHI